VEQEKSPCLDSASGVQEVMMMDEGSMYKRSRSTAG